MDEICYYDLNGFGMFLLKSTLPNEIKNKFKWVPVELKDLRGIEGNLIITNAKIYFIINQIDKDLGENLKGAAC
jgi:hypothetical protein